MVIFAYSLSAEAEEAIDDSAPRGESLKVLTYNIFMRPPINTPLGCLKLCDDQDQRVRLIGTHPDLQDYDLIIFQEAFSDSHRDEILRWLASAYEHKTRILGRGGRKPFFPYLNLDTNGGVIILSKWPIEREFQRLYSDLCVGTDCWADKGVLYARLNWNGKPLHIFGTHAQADDDQWETRRTQLINIKNLIRSMAIPSNQPVLIAGDMNVDLYNTNEYNSMLNFLETRHPFPSSGEFKDHGFTSDPANEYVDDNERKKYLDYFLYSRNHLQPVPGRASNDVRILQVGGRDLSDHYAVEGNFTFSGIGDTPTGTFPFVRFFDDNDARNGDFHCNVSIEREMELVFGYPEECDGDKVHSLILYDVPAGTVLRLYDNSQGSREDDWVEIIAKQKMSKKVIGSLERSFEDAEVQVTFFRDNGLDGEVSRLEVGFCAGDCGEPISIVSPRNEGVVRAGSAEIVEVWARFGAMNVELLVDGESQPFQQFDTESRWSFVWNVPTALNREYQLQASAVVEGVREFANAIVTAKELSPVQFENPSDGALLTLNQEITVVVDAPVETGSMELQFTPGDGHASVAMHKNGATGKWEYSWTPSSLGAFSLRAVAFDSNNVILDSETIQVTTRSTTGPFLSIDVPRVVFVEQEVTATVNAPSAISVTLFANGSALNLQGHSGSDWLFRWKPLTAGDFAFEAIAQYASLPPQSFFADVRVDNKPPVQITHINEEAFLGEVFDLKPGLLSHDLKVPTGVSTSDYACGVVGYASRGGDIGETVLTSDFQPVPPVIRVQLTPDGPGGTWNLLTWFHTRHATGGLFPRYDGDRPETWDIKFLCISRQLAFVQHLPNMGDDINENTGVDFGQYACGIAGFRAKHGDINETGTGDIFKMYLDRKDGNWFVNADFRTHNGRDEDWDIDLLCISRAVASLDAAAPETSFFVREYFDLGDNLGIDREFSTGVSASRYVCGVAGFAALHGDIDEHPKSDDANLFSAYLYPKNDTWHVRADFRTHKDAESWDVKILCALNDGFSPPPWNLSQQEMDTDACLLGKCQVLRNEAINLGGTVIVQGGGISGNPTQTGRRCATAAHIEVYLNDRDPSTGKPRWTHPPHKCLRDGDSLLLSAGGTYDLRGMSIKGGSTIPFELRDPDAPPDQFRAYPALFKAEFEPGKRYGPGMALSWRPTVHPQARYYEIEFSEDGGVTWQTYTKTRDVWRGGWINHHSNLACGYGFYKCLKRKQSYSYRVRVLRGENDPLTDWSKVVTRRSFDWPANVKLDPPSPPGPYDFSEDVTLTVSADTYGEGLKLAWGFQAWAGATYTILSGCQNGSLVNSNARTCKIRIRNDSMAFKDNGEARIVRASRIPETSVDVFVTGTDALGFVDAQKVRLGFERKDIRVRPVAGDRHPSGAIED